MRIAYTKLALERIVEIAEFRFPEAPERGRAWMGEVIDYAARLGAFPNMGRRISLGRCAAGEGQNVRRLLFKDVWIVYEVREAAPGAEAAGRDEEGPYILVLTGSATCARNRKPIDPQVRKLQTGLSLRAQRSDLDTEGDGSGITGSAPARPTAAGSPRRRARRPVRAWRR